MVVFRSVMTAQGFSPMDLWSGGTVQPIAIGAEGFLIWGYVMARYCIFSSAAAFLYDCALGVIGVVRSDPRALIVGFIGSACACVGAFLAIQLGVIITGV